MEYIIYHDGMDITVGRMSVKPSVGDIINKRGIRLEVTRVEFLLGEFGEDEEVTVFVKEKQNDRI